MYWADKLAKEIIDSGKENDPFSGEIVNFKEEYSAKLTLLMPTLGLKYYLIERNKLKAFANVFYAKPIVRAKLDVNDPSIENDFESVIKDLKIKGSSQVVKVGTKVKNIRLVDGDHNIDCKIDGIGPMKLKSELVKKI